MKPVLLERNGGAARTTPGAVARVQRFIGFLEGHQPAPGPEDRAVLAGAFRGLLEGRELEAALGLKPGPGQRSWQTKSSLAERNRLLRAAASQFFPGDRPTVQARRLHRALAHYATTGWLRERLCEVLPDSRRDTLSSALWAMLRVKDHVPSERMIRDILRPHGNELTLFVASKERQGESIKKENKCLTP